MIYKTVFVCSECLSILFNGFCLFWMPDFLFVCRSQHRQLKRNKFRPVPLPLWLDMRKTYTHTHTHTRESSPKIRRQVRLQTEKNRSHLQQSVKRFVDVFTFFGKTKRLPKYTKSYGFGGIFWLDYFESGINFPQCLLFFGITNATKCHYNYSSWGTIYAQAYLLVVKKGVKYKVYNGACW